MKEYNLFMVDVVKSLVSKGRSVSYHIYGGGNMEAKVRQKINDCGLRQCIELHGRLPYEKMEEALRSAALFVGMGTAMIEAAQLGVPSLMACPFDATGKSYGPIFNFPTSADAQQKMLAQPPARSMAEDVERVLSLSKEDYKSECQKTYEHAKYWSLSERMTEFMSIVTVAPWFKKRKWHYILNRFKYGAMYRMRRFRTN
jgi:glycosyltransferase involved in cell wall biosynthesis